MKLKAIGVCALTLAACVLAIGVLAKTRASDSVIDEGLIVGARAIVRGTVTSVESQFDNTEQRVFTYTTLKVEEVLKGQISGSDLVLKEEGGETETIGERVYGTPQFEPGERVVVYLDSWADGSPRVYQLFLGKVRIENDPGTGRDRAVRDLAGAEGLLLSGAARRMLSATAAVDLEKYVNQLRRAIVRDEELSLNFENEHYRGIPMLTRPPRYEPKISGAWVTQVATLPIAARWFEPDSNLPVSFFINPDGAPNPQVLDDVGAAIDAWASVPATSINLLNGGGKGVCVQNGIISIVFNNCDGRFQPEPDCARIIARGGIVWDNKITKQINGQTFRKAIRGFVSLNPFSACSYDNHCDLREVVTHEIGHALGLGHSEFPEATMYGSVHYDGRCASLMTDDAHSLAFVYPPVDPGPRPLAITTSAISDGIVGTHFVQVIEAEGGTMPYTWTWVFGTGRVPDGLGVDPGGALFGTLLKPGTFNFTIEVADAAGAVADREFTMTVVPASADYDSEFSGQVVKDRFLAGQPFTAVLRWLNTGTHAWDPGAGLSLVSQYPTNNSTWGLSRLTPASGPVQPGQVLEVLLTTTAPLNPGAYDFQWQLRQEGIGIFGEPSQDVSVFVYDDFPLTVDAPSIIQAGVNAPFSFQFAAAGGAPPVSWSIADGNLPAGLQLDSANGVLSGTPLTIGDTKVSIRATDSHARLAQKQLTIKVAVIPLGIEGTSSAQGVVGSPFSLKLNAIGGGPPYAWSVQSGALPAGVSLDAATGLISGTPTVSGSFQAGIAVHDSKSEMASIALQIVVSEPADVPVIISARYKPGRRKLKVAAERVVPGSDLRVDGSAVSARFNAGSLIAKNVILAPGQHEIRVVNPGGIVSPPFILTVK
jgi:hypothetical protein